MDPKLRFTMVRATLFLLLVSLAQRCRGQCDLTGNWTSTLGPGDAVHIEIHQNGAGQIQVRATPWGAATGKGEVSGHNVSLLMVGATDPTSGTIFASRYPNYNNPNQPAPDCTFLSYGWCKFPYCPIPEPVWPPWPTPSENCAVSGPCPLPPWAPTWQLNLSTVLQPCNTSGYFTDGHRWGLVSFDWNNAKALWLKPDRNATTCEELLVEQARQVKAKNPQTKVFVYRNLELALQWLSSERRAMNDPTKSDFFLKYLTGANKGRIYNEGVNEGAQYFWDFTNPKVTDWWANEVLLGPGGLGSPYVDGIFTDDVRGLGEEHSQAAANMGMTAQQVDEQHAASDRAWMAILQAAIGKKGYIWQAFGDEDGVAGGPTRANCASRMRDLCQASVRDSPVLLALSTTDVEQSIAAFLVARGPYWWIGAGWQGCTDGSPPYRPDLFDLNVGEPTGNCSEVSSGVFRRSFTRGTASLDCTSFTAQLLFN